MALREAYGIDGTPLAYRVTGIEDGRPLVLLHGWAQSMNCWGSGVLDALAANYRVIAVDLRGHGYSGAPEVGYDDSKIWAGDVAAILAAEDVTSDAVLVGWSYGGLVIADYLAECGTDAVAGIVLVGAITSIGRGQQGGRVGTAMRDAMPAALSENPGDAIRALGSFGTALTGDTEGVGPQSQALFGASLSTPPRVRAALFGRQVAHDDLLAALDVPALIVHGTADRVVDVSAGRHAAELIPNATASFWEGCDHGPFVEDPDRFVAEIIAFVSSLG